MRTQRPWMRQGCTVEAADPSPTVEEDSVRCKPDSEEHQPECHPPSLGVQQQTHHGRGAGQCPHKPVHHLPMNRLQALQASVMASWISVIRKKHRKSGL